MCQNKFVEKSIKKLPSFKFSFSSDEFRENKLKINKSTCADWKKDQKKRIRMSILFINGNSTNFLKFLDLFVLFIKIKNFFASSHLILTPVYIIYISFFEYHPISLIHCLICLLIVMRISSDIPSLILIKKKKFPIIVALLKLAKTQSLRKYLQTKISKIILFCLCRTTFDDTPKTHRER